MNKVVTRPELKVLVDNVALITGGGLAPITPKPGVVGGPVGDHEDHTTPQVICQVFVRVTVSIQRDTVVALGHCRLEFSEEGI